MNAVSARGPLEVEGFKLPLCCYRGASPMHSRRVDSTHKIYPFILETGTWVPGWSNKTFQSCPQHLLSHWLITPLHSTWIIFKIWFWSAFAILPSSGNHKTQVGLSTPWFCPLTLVQMLTHQLHFNEVKDHPVPGTAPPYKSPQWTGMKSFSPIPAMIPCSRITCFKMPTPVPINWWLIHLQNI